MHAKTLQSFDKNSKNQKRKQRYFFLFGGVFVDPTAIEIQACVRAKLFQKYLGITPTLITHGYDSNISYNYQKHIESSCLEQEIPMFGIFDFYCDKLEPATKDNDQSIQWQSNLRYEIDPKDLNICWVFLADRLQMCINYHPNTRLINYVNYINHIGDNEVEIIKRDFYDRQGYLSQVGVVDPVTKGEQVVYLLDRAGRQRITINYKIVNNQQQMVKIFISNTQGMVTDIFNSKEELVADFLQKLATLYVDDELFFILEHPVYYSGLRKIKHPNSHVISIFHNLQTLYPDVMTSPFNSHFAAPLAEYLTNPELKTILLTEQQKQDIETRLGKSDNLYVIPNTFDYQPKKVKFESRDRFLLTALTRLSPEKQLDKMVDMFAIVHNVIPQARLEIYGEGELKEQLQQQINQLSLSDAITLKGFTSQPYLVFEKAGMALLTSYYEALPLVIMESLVAGCPFISFDVKYGPSAMIKDGTNGYLIPPDDIQTMANRIIYLLSNPDLHKEICHNAHMSEKAFCMESVAKKWQKLLAELTTDPIKLIFNHQQNSK